MGQIKTAHLIRVLLTALLLAGLAPPANAQVTVCVAAGETLGLRVDFQAWFENAVVVSDSDGRRIASFNNYFGRGAGNEWQFGAASWRAPRASDRQCYIITGQHKAGPAKAELPWQPSDCRVDGAKISFEDGGTDGKNRSFDDASVLIRGGVISAIASPCHQVRKNGAAAQLKKHAKPKRSPPMAAAMPSPPPAVAKVERPAGMVEAAPAIVAESVPRTPSGGALGTTRSPASTGADSPISAKEASTDAAKPTSEVMAFTLPEFPFPPPDPSARLLIPQALLIGDAPTRSYGSVAARMESALAVNGYATLSYFAVPGGFAQITQLERINPDATPAAEQRWSVEVAPVSLRSFSLEGYIRALLQKDAGYFRVIAFVFTAEPFSSSGEQVPVDEAMKWIDAGANTLPHDIAIKPYGAEMICTALVYEFEIHTHGAEAALRKPSPHDGFDHLRASGVLGALEQ